MERNLSLYPRYRVCSDAMAWMPVFFLYFNAHLSLADVLRLEAIYYLAVVLLEVPSGYFSDRIGRRATLLLAAVAFVAAYAGFILAEGFFMFAVAQVLLATGMACRSGTDSAFLYDSLLCLDRTAEYAQREARVQRLSLAASAVAVIVGGIAGGLDLVLAYWISLAAAGASLFVALGFVEPTVDAGTKHTGFAGQLRTCVAKLRDRYLAWLFVFSVVAYILAHVPYEFYQPYLGLLGASAKLYSIEAPVASGLVLGVTMLLGAWVAGHSVDLQNRFGLNAVLLSAIVLQLVVIAALSNWLHLAVVALLFFRSVPMAMVYAPMQAAIAPRVATAQRATYLSLQSLAGRLGFSISLALVSLTVDKQPADWPTLSSLVDFYFWFGAVILACLYVSRNRN